MRYFSLRSVSARLVSGEISMLKPVSGSKKMIASGIKSKFRLGMMLHKLRQQLKSNS